MHRTELLQFDGHEAGFTRTMLTEVHLSVVQEQVERMRNSLTTDEHEAHQRLSRRAGGAASRSTRRRAISTVTATSNNPSGTSRVFSAKTMMLFARTRMSALWDLETQERPGNARIRMSAALPRLPTRDMRRWGLKNEGWGSPRPATAPVDGEDADPVRRVGVGGILPLA